MSSIVYLKNRKSNIIYAYLNEYVWDEVKKKNVCKRKCIGHVDPITGTIVPNRTPKRRNAPTVRSVHLCKVFDAASENLGLSDVLSLSFPDYWKTISTLAYYLAATDGELYFCKQWSKEHKTPDNQIMTVDVINDLLKNIDFNSISLFFTLWRLKIQPSDVYVNMIFFKEFYNDPSEYYSQMNIDIDDEKYKIKMDLYFSSKNDIPLCYELSDMSTGHRMGDYDVSRGSFSKLTSFLDEEQGDQIDASLIAYAKSNIIARVSPENEFVKGMVEKVSGTITNAENYRVMFGTPLFIETFMNHYKGKKYYTHVCYDTNLAAGDLSTFISIINGCRYEIESDKPVPEHQHLYDKYLLIREEDGGTVAEYNSEAIMHRNSTAGYSIFISNFTRNPTSALIPFLQKKDITKMFDGIINEYDNYALNLSTESYHLNRIFIQFIALILKREVTRIMISNKLNKIMSYKEMIKELSEIKMVRIPGMKKPMQTEISDVQRSILNVFGVDYEME